MDPYVTPNRTKRSSLKVDPILVVLFPVIKVGHDEIYSYNK